jgi:hypothetical protein
LRLAVRDKWERLTETKPTNKQSLNTTFKFTIKMFEGICGYCGKQGHKKETCFKKKQEDGEKGGEGETNNNSKGGKGKVKNPKIKTF